MSDESQQTSVGHVNGPEHPEAGRLQAYLDHELSVDAHEAVERHLLRCPPCQSRLEELRETGDRVSAALRALDPRDPPDTGAALWEVRRRRARRRSRTHRHHLAAAAVVLLFMGAGAAVALPGSPVRSWLEGLTDAAPAVESAEAPSRGATLAVSLDEGRAHIEVSELGRNVDVEVRLSDGADLRVEGPPGAAFRSGPGRVDVSGGRDGRLRVEIPRDALGVDLTIAGEGRDATRVEFRDGRLRVDGRAVEEPAPGGSSGWIPVGPAPSEPFEGRRDP